MTTIRKTGISSGIGQVVDQQVGQTDQKQTSHGYGEYDCFGAPENGLVLASQRDPSQDEQAYQVRLMMMSRAPEAPLVAPAERPAQMMMNGGPQAALVAPTQRISKKRLEVIQQRFLKKIEELATHEPPLTEEEAQAEVAKYLRQMKGTPFVEDFTMQQLMDSLKAEMDRAESAAKEALNW
jgi:hypothetical protein